jgi:hypothetical protein
MSRTVGNLEKTWLYSRYFLKRRELKTEAVIPKIKRARICGQRTSIPFPFNKIPLTAVLK